MHKIKVKCNRLAAAALLLVAVPVLGIVQPSPAGAIETISFGVLPVIQALPLFVAKEEGFFKAEGIDVELVPFRSSLEKDTALAAGRIQGYFGDMLTSIIMNANHVPVRMVATIYNTTGDQRMFAVLAAPGKGKPSLAELAEEGIAGASNTIIEYFISKLLAGEAPGTRLNMIEAKSIPSRVPMLLSSQVPGAALPEPLVTFVEMKGATVVADDRGIGIAPTVLTFTNKFLSERRTDTEKFLKATTRASSLISRNPEAVRPTMIKHARVPELLQDSFAIPVFVPLSIPKRVLVMDTYTWLREKGVLNSELTWSKMVQEGLL